MNTILYAEQDFLRIRDSFLPPWFESQKSNLFGCKLKRIFGFDAPLTLYEVLNLIKKGDS